jgi:hypothetical protein
MLRLPFRTFSIARTLADNCSVARGTPSGTIPDFRVRALGWCNALSLHCGCAVLRHRTGMPICFIGLSRVCVWLAIRGEGVVGPHSGTCRGFWRCAGVYRVASVARLQEI